VILVWRLAINPVSSWWRDPPAILAAFWIAYTLAAAGEDRTRLARAVTLVTMALLLALFAWRQVPLTLRVLGLAS
jgi:hypothetical protein